MKSINGGSVELITEDILAFEEVVGSNTDAPPSHCSERVPLNYLILNLEVPNVKLNVVSHNGASGIFPDSSDLAYNQTIQDGADYIDCTVQMTQDGIPICFKLYRSLTSIKPAISNPFFSQYKLVRNPA